MSNAPTKMLYNCIVAINKTTYFIAQGQGDGYTSDARSTYFFNFEKRILTPGPQFIAARHAFSCSRIRNPITGMYNIIAAGGLSPSFKTLNSTEILDVSTHTWRLGPVLPLAIFSTQMVEHYKGGVVLIGGRIQNVDPQNYLFHLPSENEEWYIMEKKLLQPRAEHIAFLIPSSFINCTN